MNSEVFLNFTVNFLLVLREIFTYALIARIILSWFRMGKGEVQGPISKILVDVTDPILRLAKKIPHRIGMIDLSPLIALLGIDLFVRLCLYLLGIIF